ncbi:MAG: hypothetical protein OJF50_000268 [Nitrospira sp.]|nr:hypothetical protein [Nitrospira sp.]
MHLGVETMNVGLGLRAGIGVESELGGFLARIDPGREA